MPALVPGMTIERQCPIPDKPNHDSLESLRSFPRKRESRCCDSEASVLGSPLSRGRAENTEPPSHLDPKLAAALAALVDAEKKLLQCRPLPDQTLLM